MSEPALRTPLASLLVSFSFCAVLSAQIHIPPAAQPVMPPQPPHALPITPPPVDHPALAGQPGMHRDQPTPDSSGSSAGPTAPGAKPPEPDPAEVKAQEFLQKRLQGKDLKRAVGRVLKDLDWKTNLADARASSAARGLPILLVQALGELDGFA